MSSPNFFPWLPHCLGGGGTITAKPRVLHLSGPPGLAKAQDRLATSCVVSSAWMAMASLQTALGSVRGPLVHGQMMSGVFSDHFPSGLAKKKGLNLLFTAKFESIFFTTPSLVFCGLLPLKSSRFSYGRTHSAFDLPWDAGGCPPRILQVHPLRLTWNLTEDHFKKKIMSSKGGPLRFHVDGREGQPPPWLNLQGLQLFVC